MYRECTSVATVLHYMIFLDNFFPAKCVGGLKKNELFHGRGLLLAIEKRGVRFITETQTDKCI